MRTWSNLQLCDICLVSTAKRSLKISSTAGEDSCHNSLQDTQKKRIAAAKKVTDRGNSAIITSNLFATGQPQTQPNTCRSLGDTNKNTGVRSCVKIGPRT